ncbi:MAG: hypothetical protein ABI068_05205 [Ktedonobacterales bacterium]
MRQQPFASAFERRQICPRAARLIAEFFILVCLVAAVRLPAPGAAGIMRPSAQVFCAAGLEQDDLAAADIGADIVVGQAKVVNDAGNDRVDAPLQPLVSHRQVAPSPPPADG